MFEQKGCLKQKNFLSHGQTFIIKHLELKNVHPRNSTVAQIDTHKLGLNNNEDNQGL